MRLDTPTRRRLLRIPEIPRFAPGLALLTGGIGFALGADSLSGEMIAALVIVELAAVGLIASAGLDRSQRLTRIRRRGENAEGARQFGRELARARRRETPLTIVRLPRVGDSARPVQRRDVASIRRQLRRIDIVWVRGGDVLLVLPETDGVAAANLIERLRARVPAALVGAEPAVAAFPGDGLTAGSLLAVVEGRPPLGPAPSPTPSLPTAPPVAGTPAISVTGVPTPSLAQRMDAGGVAGGSTFSAMSALADPSADRDRAPTDFV